MIPESFGPQDNQIPEQDSARTKRKNPKGSDEVDTAAKKQLSQGEKASAYLSQIQQRLKNKQKTLKEKIKVRQQQKRSYAEEGEQRATSRKKAIEEDTSSEPVGKKRAKHADSEEDDIPIVEAQPQEDTSTSEDDLIERLMRLNIKDIDETKDNP